VNTLGGYGARGRGEAEAKKILSDAQAIADAGAFTIVLEGVMDELATRVAAEIAVPIIGIGASAQCDGQILVTDDMLGLFERTPRFVKRYDNLAEQIGKAAETYAAEVRSRAFPSAEQTYRPKGS
jgi:3-methyl-2-oxobutanoate hydroxymethyltransferase